MHVFKTVQGWLVTDVVNGYFEKVHYIGYTKKQAIKKFKQQGKKISNGN